MDYVYYFIFIWFLIELTLLINKKECEYKTNYVKKQLTKAQETNNYYQKIQLIKMKIGNDINVLAKYIEPFVRLAPPMNTNYINIGQIDEESIEITNEILTYLLDLYKLDMNKYKTFVFSIIGRIIKEKSLFLREKTYPGIFYLSYLESMCSGAPEELNLINTYVFPKYDYKPKYNYDIYNPFILANFYKMRGDMTLKQKFNKTKVRPFISIKDGEIERLNNPFY
jgi:hypothetical protein